MPYLLTALGSSVQIITLAIVECMQCTLKAFTSVVEYQKLHEQARSKAQKYTMPMHHISSGAAANIDMPSAG